MIKWLTELVIPSWALPVAGLLIGLAGATAVTRWYYTGQIARMERDAAAAALQASEQSRIIEDRYRQIADDAERQHHEDQTKTNALYDANRKLLTDGVRFKARCGRLSEGTSSPADTPNGTAEVRLPDAFVSDLLTLARDADRSADYARAGHAWASTIGR